jgi:glutamate-1-semialdehyde 2,1-aminomutase
VLVDGVSHGARLFWPYPFRITAARGPCVTDLDGHQIIDFWQGHFANILGHNPAVILDALRGQLDQGFGLQTGIPDEAQTELAATLARATGADQVRLTTAGTLATMYAIMLARAYTGRSVVLKIGGGWHGANPLALKGVTRTDKVFAAVDSAGISSNTDNEVLITRFNDVEALHEMFRQQGERIACFIFEPCPGGGGFIPATRAFMAAARELTRHYGALLILDEVITGFRYCAAGVQRLYGVQADLSTFGKIIGGGMPISAVVGRGDVMARASESAPERVWFNGGTFAEHPLCMRAGQAMLDYLIAHEQEVYPMLAARARRLQEGIERVFAGRGIFARCTGQDAEALPNGSSLSWVNLMHDDAPLTSPEDVTDPARCDVVLREKALKLGLVLHGVNVSHGLGAVSLSHSDETLARTLEAYDAVAKRIAEAR